MKRVLLVPVAIAFILLGGASGAYAQSEFRASLSGANEVPAVSTIAFGLATFDVNFARSVLSIDFKLNVFNLGDAFMGHIHCAAPGVNGPIVAWLAGTPSAPPNAAYELNGQWVSARMTASAVVPGVNCNGNIINTLTDLITLMANGNAYVNVHSRTNPGGEIRGQITVVAPFTVP